MSTKVADYTAFTFNATTHDLTFTATLYAPDGAALAPDYQDAVPGYVYDLYAAGIAARVPPAAYNANAGKQPSDPTWTTSPNEVDVANYICEYVMPRQWSGPAAPAGTAETPPPFVL